MEKACLIKQHIHTNLQVVIHKFVQQKKASLIQPNTEYQSTESLMIMKLFNFYKMVLLILFWLQILCKITLLLNKKMLQNAGLMKSQIMQSC
jgi:hypothetical protein